MQTRINARSKVPYQSNFAPLTHHMGKSTVIPFFMIILHVLSVSWISFHA